MGFFSSRKAEPTPLTASERSSLNAIRSRFYGKNKNLSGRSTSIPATPSSSLPIRRDGVALSQSPLVTGRQASKNALTMSLAQRLNDLAVANADGLLSDDEYRLLRQNLFERFAANSDAPTEPPVVPISVGSGTRDSYRHIARTPSISSQRSITNTVSTLFRRATGRSVASASASVSVSAAGSVSSLQQQISPPLNTPSIDSRPSFSSGMLRSPGYSRTISRRPSVDSLMSTSQAGSTTASLTKDLRGILSQRDVLANGSGRYPPSISSRNTSRSNKPPSSFHLRQLHVSPRVSERTHEHDNDEEHPKSAAELRAEIEIVESEGRNLLDAFNGLELTVLTKSRTTGPPPDGSSHRRRLGVNAEAPPRSTTDLSHALVADRPLTPRKLAHGQEHSLPLVSQPVHLKRRPSIVHSITNTFKSSASDVRTGFLSSAPPLYGSRSSPNLVSPEPPSVSSLPAFPLSVSNPSVSPNKRPSIIRQQKQQVIPSASRGPLVVPPVSPSPLPKRPSVVVTEPALVALDAELKDIRRRKADVTKRYELRLDFLRAKLKSAEIRERLSKK